MSVDGKKTIVKLVGECGVEEAETLLEWMHGHPQGQVDLGRCRHLHTAVLQVLMATGRSIKVWPEDPNLRIWLDAAGIKPHSVAN